MESSIFSTGALIDCLARAESYDDRPEHESTSCCSRSTPKAVLHCVDAFIARHEQVVTTRVENRIPRNPLAQFTSDQYSAAEGIVEQAISRDPIYDSAIDRLHEGRDELLGELSFSKTFWPKVAIGSGAGALLSGLAILEHRASRYISLTVVLASRVMNFGRETQPFLRGGMSPRVVLFAAGIFLTGAFLGVASGALDYALDDPYFRNDFRDETAFPGMLGALAGLTIGAYSRRLPILKSTVAGALIGATLGAAFVTIHYLNSQTSLS